MRLPLFHIEDVFLTGFCAERCGFPRKAYGHIHPEKAETTKELITTHHNKPEQMKKLFQELEKLN